MLKSAGLTRKLADHRAMAKYSTSETTRTVNMAPCRFLQNSFAMLYEVLKGG